MFVKFKKLKLHIDEEIYKKVKNQVQTPCLKKKRDFYEINLKQKINKPKELWRVLKSMSLPSKVASASNICLKDKYEMVFDETKNCTIFKSLFSNLAQNLIYKLPPSPSFFVGSKVAFYYDNIKFKDLNFEFSETSWKVQFEGYFERFKPN